MYKEKTAVIVVMCNMCEIIHKLNNRKEVVKHTT